MAIRHGSVSHQDPEQSGRPQWAIPLIETLEHRLLLSGSIEGMVWQDVDANGLYDIGEAPLAGVTVYLDLNDNGVKDSGETETLTDADGRYTFTDLAPGDYTVAQIVPGGYEQTSPVTTSDPIFQYNPATGVMSLLTNGHHISEIVVRGPAPETLLVDLSAMLTNDRGQTVLWQGRKYFYDSMQLYDATSSGMSGVYDLARYATGLTAADFGDVEWGAIVAAGQAGISGHATVTTSTPTLVSNTHRVSVQAGQDVTGVGFGNRMVPGEIRGRVWDDSNANGAADNGELPLGGVTFYLDLNTNGRFDSGEPRQTTDATGTFAFTDIQPGTYTVVLVVPAGYTQASPDVITVTVAAGRIVTNVDFINTLVPIPADEPGEIHGMAWDDVNGDGTKDADESPLAGVTIFLDTDGDGWHDPGEMKTTTDADGQYSFSALAPGTYRVAESTPLNHQNTSPRVRTVVLASGGIVTDVTFASRIARGRIYGLVWEDLDADGLFEPGEGGLGDVTVYLDLNTNGQLDPDEPQTTTRYNGQFLFRDLLPGTYTIAQVMPDGHTLTSPDTLTVELTLGQTLRGRQADGTLIAFGNLRDLGEIHGLAWDDVNGDGIQGADELPLAGVTVYLDTDHDGRKDFDEPETTTDADGLYSFARLTPGAYKVTALTP